VCVRVFVCVRACVPVRERERQTVWCVCVQAHGEVCMHMCICVTCYIHHVHIQTYVSQAEQSAEAQEQLIQTQQTLHAAIAANAHELTTRKAGLSKISTSLILENSRMLQKKNDVDSSEVELRFAKELHCDAVCCSVLQCGAVFVCVATTASGDQSGLQRMSIFVYRSPLWVSVSLYIDLLCGSLLMHIGLFCRSLLIYIVLL